jgi:glycosyltransferase involved in cell wall biosynthesis
MKVLHITYFSRSLNNGIFSILVELVKLQNQIENVSSKVLITYSNFPIEHNNFFLENSLEGQLKMVNNFNPDLIVFHNIYSIKYFKILKHLKNRIPYIIVPHASFNKYSHKKSFLKKFIFKKIFLDLFVENAKAISYLNQNEFQNSIYNKKRYHILANGILPKTIERKYSSNIVKIMYVGRIDIHAKGLDQLLKVLTHASFDKYNYEIDIYGDGTKSDVRYLSKELKRINSVHLNYHGSVQNQKKHEVFLEHDALILTSRYEGFPMTILEAWSYLMPVIITTETNVSDDVLHFQTGKVINKNSLLADIEAFVEDYSNKSTQFYYNCSKIIQEKYDLNLIATDSIKLYESIINS